MTNSNNSAILFCALEFVCNLFLYYDRNVNGLATLKNLNGVQGRSGLPPFLYFCYDISSFAKQ